MIPATAKPVIKEFGRIVIDGMPTPTVRVRMIINNREFVRLFQWGYKEVWREENVGGFCEDQQHKDLEEIFKAWCLDNKVDADNPQKLIEQ